MTRKIRQKKSYNFLLKGSDDLYVKPTQKHRMDQLLHKTLDWKCKQCFQDKNFVKPKTTGNQCTENRTTL